MGCLADIWEVILELLQEYIFSLIKKHVKCKFLRGVLYVLTVLAIIALAMIPVVLFFALIFWLLETALWILDWISGLLS